MLEYRVYAFEKNGHIKKPPVVIDCKDDAEAVKNAQRLLNGQAIEVWSNERIVVHIDPMHD
jgi:hypothetical protein